MNSVISPPVRCVGFPESLDSSYRLKKSIIGVRINQKKLAKSNFQFLALEGAKIAP